MMGFVLAKTKLQKTLVRTMLSLALAATMWGCYKEGYRMHAKASCHVIGQALYGAKVSDVHPDNTLSCASERLADSRLGGIDLLSDPWALHTAAIKPVVL